MIAITIYGLAPEVHSELKAFIEEFGAEIDSKTTFYGDFDDYIRLPQESAILLLNGSLIITRPDRTIALPTESYGRLELL